MAMNFNEVKGLGEKSLLLLKKLQVGTVRELLEYYPYRYEIIRIASLRDCINTKGTVNVEVASSPVVKYLGGHLNRLGMKCLYNGTLINVSIFNRGYLRSRIVPGMYISITGKYDSLRNSFTASDISLEAIKTSEIIPIYHLVSGLNNKQIRLIIKNTLESRLDVDDYIPKNLNDKYHLMSKKEAIRIIHEPDNLKDLKQARLKLIYEEFFVFAFKINYLKKLRNTNRGIKKNVSLKNIKNFIESLPFPLTEDQEKTVEAIYQDTTRNIKMNRLVLGDVGSGKTVVALCAMVMNKEAGYQSAMLVPTEVLAHQHYTSLKEMASQMNFGLLVGSMSLKEKRQVLEELIYGKIDCLIGTHAILNDKVAFKSLGLVVTDEQHRFGVNQRNIIENKGLGVDVIYMSATPIPRTYALGLYGDMDVSIIKSKPKGRKPVITKMLLDKDIMVALKTSYDALKDGHQVYVVAPLVEENEEEKENSLEDVKRLEEKFNVAFKGKYKTGILYGKMNKETKNQVMKDFKEGIIKILISTTVIEVGVDVSNATVMIIYDANLFGLATLHQLRGRVGRSGIQSFCFLVSKVEEERLRVLESSNDGFYISEKDFEMRGSGELFGEKQSGDMTFKIGNIKTDGKIWLQAYKDATEYVNNFDDDKLYLDVIKNLRGN